MRELVITPKKMPAVAGNFEEVAGFLDACIAELKKTNFNVKNQELVAAVKRKS